MIDEKLLKWVRCPISGQRLCEADTETVASINKKISVEQLRDRSDQLVTDRLDGGLVTGPTGFLYPVRGGIPTLIADSAIELRAVIDLTNPTDQSDQ